MSAYIISIVNQNAYIVKIIAIVITSNNALKALKVGLTTLINKGGVWGFKDVVSG